MRQTVIKRRKVIAMSIAPFEFKGFVISKDGGPDAPWRAWREDGAKLRADTLAGLKASVSNYIKGN